MAWVTEINADEQVDYRLARQAGCGVVNGIGVQVAAGENRAVDYRLEADAEGVLVWVGSGLADVGLAAGDVLDAEGEAAVRRLMKGCDPSTGGRLVTGRTSVRADEKATLAVAPLLRAIEARASEEGVEPEDLLEGKPKQLAKLKQQQRMVDKKARLSACMSRRCTSSPVLPALTWPTSTARPNWPPRGSTKTCASTVACADGTWSSTSPNPSASWPA